jgi:hypothetical protein
MSRSAGKVVSLAVSLLIATSAISSARSINELDAANSQGQFATTALPHTDVSLPNSASALGGSASGLGSFKHLNGSGNLASGTEKSEKLACFGSGYFCGALWLYEQLFGPKMAPCRNLQCRLDGRKLFLVL